MQKLLTDIIDGLYSLFSGDSGDNRSLKEKCMVVGIWLLVAVFCITMLNLFV